MIVRWKPLLFLSGLFVVIALIGVVAMAFTLIPKGSADILPAARAERAARQYDRALIHYGQALQVDEKNATIHEEMAAMYAEWEKTAPANKLTEIRTERANSLKRAARYGKNLKEPRRALLDLAMNQDEVQDSLYWARDLLALEPNNLQAHYVLASEGLSVKNPNIPEIKRHLAALEEAKAPEVRVAMVQARLAEQTGDATRRETVLTGSRGMVLPENASPVDLSALLRLRALDVQTTDDIAGLTPRVKTLQSDARTLVASTTGVPNIVVRLSSVLESVQSRLLILASNTKDPSARQTITSLVDAIDEDVEAIFQQSLTAARKSNLKIYFNYAAHLKFRGKRERSMEIIDEALKTPLAHNPAQSEVMMSLHELAVVDALSDSKDKERYDKAAPHIQVLLASSLPVYQGLGHLFQGAIEMEQSGMASGEPESKSSPADSTAKLAKLRSSALDHLKKAALQFPEDGEAQARYGVALISVQDQELARQYLQNALRLGTTDPQFQLWAAWSIVHAGYPEDAEPIVSRMLADVSAGRISRDYEGTLHLLSGEIHQGKRSPEDLKLAQAEFERASSGQSTPAAVVIRLAQIDTQLGHPDQALKRLESLRSGDQGTPGAESLAVIALLEMNKKDEARDVLAKARERFPDSEELVGLESSLLTRDKKLKEAEEVLASYLKRHPENVSVVMTRSQVLADLGEIKEARRILANVADRSDNSAPLVQLALLDLKEKNYEAVAATIAKVRGRWKDAATADLLEAQVALDQDNATEAIAHFDAALKKDPGNKVVQYWKARMESRTGSTNDAQKTLEEIAKQGSSKQIEDGLSVAAAANSALANLAIQNGDVDAAIQRFEGLRKQGSLGGLTRVDRWQLTLAYTVKNQWQAAKREVKQLLDDPKDPPSLDERVRAANFYKQAKEDAAAMAQLDYVLQLNPRHPSAVVSKAMMLADSRKLTEAAALLHKAIEPSADDKEKPPPVFFLLLAAVENSSPPEADAGKRALGVIEKGLVARPKALELVQAKYRLLLGGMGTKAAVAYVESEAKDDDSSGTMTRLLADVYRDQGELDSAEKTLTELVAKNPKDAKLATALVQVTGMQAVKAGDRAERDLERSYLDKTDTLIRDFRTRFPTEVAFLREDCEQAFRRGDVVRATAVTNEIDKLAKNSPVGPLLRAQIYNAQGRTSDAVDSYKEALTRNPRQPAVRVLLGQKDLAIGQTDEALKQAKLALDVEPDRADALLLAARAQAQPTSSPSQTAARQAQAIETLTGAIKRQPKFSAGYHLLAEIRFMQGKPAEALSALRAGVEAVPDDALGIAQIIELLARVPANAKAPSAESLAEAERLAQAVDARDTKGGPTLAVAVGFHKAEQFERARVFGEKAANKLDTPLVHMNYGDILLSLAERARDDSEAKLYSGRAIEQYDQVLKTQANSIEAVNNKAWILHSYFNENKKALELMDALQKRVDPSILPAEFFDTVGAIQESLGNARAAEDTYSKGLRKNSNHPVLNYHMAKLISGDTRRVRKAKDYLQKAIAQKEKLTPSMMADLANLTAQIDRN
jgi:tetratricopeptide (TPR) repeat protein